VSNTETATGTTTVTSARRTASGNQHDRPPSSYPGQRVDAVLRALPSHGWTAGWVGRRDRALVVLSQLAGLSFGTIAGLTAGDLSIVEGVATIRTVGSRTTLRPVDDDLLCGPCALARWVHALDLTVVYPDGRVIAAVIARAVPVTADSPHLCQTNNTITEVTRRVALLPPIDHWGHPIRAVSPLSSPAPPRLAPGARPLATDGRGQVPTQRPSERQLPSITHDLTHRALGLQRRTAQLFETEGPVQPN